MERFYFFWHGMPPMMPLSLWRWAHAPPPIEVRLIPPQTQQAPLAKSQFEHKQQIEKPLATLSHLPDVAQGSSETRHSTLPKLINLRTGQQLNPSYWRGVKIQGSPVRIQLTINPAGFIHTWKLLTKTTESFQLDLEAMNHMIRNMDIHKTGETHAQFWEYQIGEKNGELIAKIYPVSAD